MSLASSNSPRTRGELLAVVSCRHPLARPRRWCAHTRSGEPRARGARSGVGSAPVIGGAGLTGTSLAGALAHRNSLADGWSPAKHRPGATPISGLGERPPSSHTRNATSGRADRAGVQLPRHPETALRPRSQVPGAGLPEALATGATGGPKRVGSFTLLTLCIGAGRVTCPFLDVRSTSFWHIHDPVEHICATLAFFRQETVKRVGS